MGTLHLYLIPDQEGDGRSLITGSGMDDLNIYFSSSSKGILHSEWKSKNDFLLVQVPGRFVGSRKERNRKRNRPSGSFMICLISFICLALS